MNFFQSEKTSVQVTKLTVPLIVVFNRKLGLLEKHIIRR